MHPCFDPKGVLFWEDVKREYVKRCVEWDNDVHWTKHTLREMIMHHSCLEFAEGKALTRCKTLANVADIYGFQSYYRELEISRSRSELASCTEDCL